MVMRSGVRFKAKDWKLFTAAQQTKMKELAAQKRYQRSKTTVQLNNASTETTVATPSCSVATSPNSSASPDIHQLLSNSHLYQLYWSQHSHWPWCAVQGQGLETIDCCTANKDEGACISEA
jgi:hypothetical protein